MKSLLTSFIVALLALFTAVPLALASADNAELHKPVCSVNQKNEPRCHARVVVDSRGSPHVSTQPSGYSPAQFLGAYSLGSGIASESGIIAVVDAFDHPNILSDLNTYSAKFGIPLLPGCGGPIATSPTPCFQKVDQNGGTNYPSVNSGWALETSLDVEVVHAICQNCKILLVEASTNSYYNLMTAVDTAINLGAKVISNSYGSQEFLGQSVFNSHFNHTGIAITFSSGDSGYGTSYPASSPYVTAVGGTTLNLSGVSRQGESVWGGAGSGCSAFEAKPLWQIDSGCSNRTVSDVSADADPQTGASVYDSVRYQGKKGWFKVGGTSLSSPIIAGVYGLSGVPAGVFGNSLPYSLYNYSSNIFDITNGSNGNCLGSYLCTGLPGYDGPTGLGTPNGTSAF